MSECQYYEFVAVDRPLGAAALKALSAISSRARIGDRNPKAYDRAAAMIADLGEIAVAAGERAGFLQRIADLRHRHQKKPRLLERLRAIASNDG